MKPVELVVTNTLYDALETVSGVGKQVPSSVYEKLVDQLLNGDGGEVVTRRLLCEIAHGTSISTVLKALAAVGGPSTIDEVTRRMRCILDQRGQDGARAMG